MASIPIRTYFGHGQVKASQFVEMNSSIIWHTGLPNFCIHYLVEWMTDGGVPLYGDGAWVGVWTEEGGRGRDGVLEGSGVLLLPVEGGSLLADIPA